MTERLSVSWVLQVPAAWINQDCGCSLLREYFLKFIWSFGLAQSRNSKPNSTFKQNSLSSYTQMQLNTIIKLYPGKVMVCQHLYRTASPCRGAGCCLLRSVRVWQTRHAFLASLATSQLVASLQLIQAVTHHGVTGNCGPGTAVHTLHRHPSSFSLHKQKDNTKEKWGERGKKGGWKAVRVKKESGIRYSTQPQGR